MKIITACAGFSLLLAASAFASEPARFQWSAADLRSSDGIVATHQRIQTQAMRFCRERLRGTRGISQRMTCERAVVGEIVEHIDDHRLSTYAATGDLNAALTAAR